MISMADCISFCDIEKILQIAAHVPEIVAGALAGKLMQSEHGPEFIRDMIRDNVRSAIRCGVKQHARELIVAMHHFLSVHPEAIVKAAPHAVPSI